jgi:hypothetical protein
MNRYLLKINVLVLLIIHLLICLIALNVKVFYKDIMIRQHVYNNCTSHESAVNQAIKDINNGKKYVFLRGLLDINKDEEVKMINEQKEYDFTYISLECVGGDKFTWTYEQIMRREINEKAKKYVFRTFDKYTLEHFDSKKFHVGK